MSPEQVAHKGILEALIKKGYSHSTAQSATIYAMQAYRIVSLPILISRAERYAKQISKTKV